MADVRLYNPAVRYFLASPLAFANWQEPTSGELNANPTNDPNGLIWDMTCALYQDDTSFNLADSETDEELSFCQVAGAATPVTFNPEVTWTAFRSDEPWVISEPTTYDQANLAFSLLAWRGVEYFVIKSTGEEPGTPFAPGQRVSLVRVATDFATDVVGPGENVKLTQAFLRRGDLNWRYELTA